MIFLSKTKTEHTIHVTSNISNTSPHPCAPCCLLSRPPKRRVVLAAPAGRVYPAPPDPSPAAERPRCHPPAPFSSPELKGAEKYSHLDRFLLVRLCSLRLLVRLMIPIQPRFPVLPLQLGKLVRKSPAKVYII